MIKIIFALMTLFLESYVAFAEAVQSWDKLSQLIPTNSVYEKQDQNVSPSSRAADGAPLARSSNENNVMDTSKLKGEEGDHEEMKGVEEEEEEESKLTYDAEEYEDEDKREKAENQEEEQAEEEEELEEEEDPPDTDGATKKERSPAETSNVSNTETANDSRDEDYLEDQPNQYDTYYYYDEYENGNRSRYEAVGGFPFFVQGAITMGN